MRHLFLICFLLFLSAQLFSQVLINEFSSDNLSGIRDEDGDSCDWIELFNHSDTEINLDGYHLSDDTRFLSRWTFPAISLKPDAYLLVFASGKNRTGLPLSYQTIIQKGANWEYLVPSSETGDSWKDTGFDASAWSIGPSGFGYGDGDDATVDTIISIFIRKEFTITNLQDVQELLLSIDYDDGFVALKLQEVVLGLQALRLHMTSLQEAYCVRQPCTRVDSLKLTTFQISEAF
jgi:hypothetical protein